MKSATSKGKVLLQSINDIVFNICFFGAIAGALFLLVVAGMVIYSTYFKAYTPINTIR